MVTLVIPYRDHIWIVDRNLVLPSMDESTWWSLDSRPALCVDPT